MKRTFDLEETRLRKEITKRGAKLILIQLPEGLKAEGPRLAAMAEEAGALAIVSADPCYGACDLVLADAESLGADIIIHYGHSFQIKQERVPTIYIEARAKISVKGAVKEAIPLLKHWSSIGLVTTVQHVHTLNEARELLIEAGKTVSIGDAGQAKYAGQVTGCDYSNARSISKEVDAFLFIGGGRFHAVGVALATAKPTIIADPYEKRAYPIRDEVQRILKQRWASISEAKKAEKFGVLIGLKSGQKKVEEAMEAKEKLEKKGKKTTLLALREITPETLMQFPPIDAFVNTACPRVSLDDASSFPKPVLTFEEMLVMVGEMSWEELCGKGWFGR
ncbi:MAG: 2-(3-amino-3-carboxypropyl)histidine synthase [Candidatus Bathyarchaeota archaeon BA2]|nr:MAG: 2-(3-amino-3-carboxypropyl)histidine synthase [Candidatus Bathyarchaeota archaeon BA2]